MDNDSDDTNWKRLYWITALLGISYVILLGIFTLIFNTPTG